MKYLFIIASCFVFVLTAQGQYGDRQAYYDSLIREQTQHTKRDTNLVNIWVGLAEVMKFNRPDSSIYYATRAIELSRKIGFAGGEVAAIDYLGVAYRTMGNLTSALHTDLEGLRRAEELGDKGNHALFLFVLSIDYYQIGNYINCLDYARRACSIFKSIGSDLSIDFFANSSANMGKAYAATGQLDSAFFYCYRGIRSAESIRSGSTVFKAYTYAKLGEIYRDLHSNDSALHYFQKSLAVVNNNEMKSQMALEIARLLDIKGQKDSCIYYADLALQTALKYKLYDHITAASQFISGFFENSDPVKALQYNKMALAYKDSLSMISKMTGFTEFASLDELQRQEQLEATQKAYRDKIRLYLLASGLIIFLIVILLLYRNNKNKQKAKKKIEEAYHQLKSTQSQLIQSEKMASLGELTAGIAHEIQNPLNFVNNFSEVSNELVSEMKDEFKKGDIEEGFAIADDIKQNLEKINHHGKRADAIVKSMLEHSRSSTGVKEPTDINKLADEYLRLAYHGLRAKDKNFNAEMKVDFDESIGKINIIPQDIGRVLLNLFNNAFYAVSQQKSKNSVSYQPTVSVTTKKSENSVTITVKDNGGGIPEKIKEKIFQPFFTTKPTGSGTGLGLSLSYDIIKAHGGEIKVETREGEGLATEEAGTIFIIQLPIKTD